MPKGGGGGGHAGGAGRPARSRSNPLSEQERRAVSDYTGSEYGRLNTRLREGHELEHYQRELAEHLDAVLAKLPAYKKTTYRVLDVYGEQELAKFVSQHEVGAVVSYKQFVSSAKEPGSFGSWATWSGKNIVRLTIEGKSGRSIQHLSQFTSEKEVLFGRKARFTVTHRSQRGSGGWDITIKEL